VTLSLESDDDKLKRIGYSLKHFTGVECTERRRHAEAYRTLVEAISPALSVRSDDDKLKRIGHSLKHFTGVECTERRRQAEAYRTFVAH